MKIIDFDHQFAHYAEHWMKENRSKFRNVDEMEAQMPDVYLRWLNQPAEWLDGAAPGTYFAQYGDVEMLLNWLRAYFSEQVPAPDQLLERIVDLGEPAVAPLMALVEEEQAPEELRITALNLLSELGSDRPMALCLRLVSERAGEDLADVAAELLTNLGRRTVAPILERMESASEAARETFLDVVCNFPGDERIYTYVMDAFLKNPERRALFASYLGKLGDSRALPALKQALSYQDLNYLDYVEIKNAVEELGEEVEDAREFAGDPYYESLKKME